MFEFSIVIPVYNEEENVSELHRRLGTVMERLGNYEDAVVLSKKGIDLKIKPTAAFRCSQ